MSEGPRVADVVDLDLTDPATFSTGPPYEQYALLRREAPVAWHPHLAADGRPGFWVVTRYDDAMTVEHDPGTFSSSARWGGTLIEPAGADAELHIINRDPPEHTRLRAHLRELFTARHVRSVEDHLRATAKEVVTAAAARDEIDLATDVAARIPAPALAELLELPAEDRPTFCGWIDELMGDEPVDRSRAPSAAATELFAYVDELADRDATAGTVIGAVLAHETAGGDRIDPVELAMFFVFLAIAGNSTPRSVISGGALALLEHPGELARLQDDPSLLPAAVEEVLRHVSPVNYIRRTATRATRLGGVAIAAGDKVTVWYSSANRDEAQFADPDRFDVGRTPNRHVAFGGPGPHFCLGAGFARLGLAVTLAELVDHLLPHVERAGPVERPRQVHANEISHLPLRRRAATAPGARHG